MKQFLIMMFLVIISCQSFAQNDFQSPSNKMYWKNKQPNAAYWQQDVHYKIKASISEITNIITASEELIYTNNSPDELSFVYFHLYQNAFTKGSYLQELHRVNKQPIGKLGKYQDLGLGTTVSNLMVNSKLCKIEMDNTIMKVYLPETLKPGESVTFSMDFNTYFESGGFRRRMNMYNSFGYKHFNGVHWYPRISVYDKKKGWDVDQHLNKELYGDYGLFDVELTFADNYVVEATGALQNSEEVYPGDLRQRLDIKNFVNKPWNEKPSVITPYDSSKRKTWHYVATNVHDFAFTADPTYRIGESSWKGVQCIAIVTEPHASKWQTAADYVAKIIKTFSEDFGMYEYPKMVAADANDGMEYPMLTLDGGAEPDFHGLFAHEIGHNWFYGMIGNNETYRAALDEGFTQFLTAWGLQHIDGDTMIATPLKNKYVQKNKEPLLTMDRNVYNRYMFDAVREIDKPLNTHSNDFHSAIGHENGYSNVYHKTATMLYNLQYLLGDELFQNAMRHYVAKWKIAHPYFEDFRESIIEFTHQDLNWFFDQWMETTKSTDYSITSIKKTLIPNQYKIKFKRYGQMQMPIDFRVTDKKNIQTDYTIPNTYFQKKTDNKILKRWYGWDLLYPTYTAKIDVPNGLRSVQIDPTNRLADVNMMNNSKQIGHLFSKKSYSLQRETFVSNTPSWKKYQAFWRPDIWYNAIDGIKPGIHFDGSYMNYMRKLNATVWFNTRLISPLKYRAFENESWWKGISPIDYSLSYESPLKQINKDINIGFESRMLEGFAKHSIQANYHLSKQDDFKIEATTLYRYGQSTRNYLFAPEEWSSFLGNAIQTKANTFLQLSYNHQYSYMVGKGNIKTIIRAPFTYNYTFAQAEWINKKPWKKLDINTRIFARKGWGSDIPTESALYLQGANPEELMENKFTRSHGVLPLNWGGFSTNNFSNIHGGGGLNLRGFTGYYALDENQKGDLFINYKSQSGASMNAEIEFDKYIKLKPKYLNDYLHIDAYLFGDLGLISRGTLNFTQVNSLKPISSWSKLRADAGLGLAWTIKRFGPLDKIKPFTFRTDFPIYISSAPFAKPKNIDFRWVLGINRAF